MKDLNQLFEICKEELRSINIPFCENTTCRPNSRAKRRWGLCTREAFDSYSIQVSTRLLVDTVDDKATKTTILHELLHTVPGGNSHTGAWKTYANKVNRLLGYNISRTTSAAEKGVEESAPILKAKFKIVCSKCGCTWYRSRSTAVTQNPSHYHCHCGGSLDVHQIY